MGEFYGKAGDKIMKVICCDRCKKLVRQALHISVKLVKADEYTNIDLYNTGDIDGDYCQSCLDEINEIVNNYKAGD